MLYITIEVAEVLIPNAVFTSASEIDAESAVELPEPAFANEANALIIPNTVPNRPVNVPIDTRVAIMVRFCSSIGISNVVASSMSF